MSYCSRHFSTTMTLLSERSYSTSSWVLVGPPVASPNFQFWSIIDLVRGDSLDPYPGCSDSNSVWKLIFIVLTFRVPFLEPLWYWLQNYSFWVRLWTVVELYCKQYCLQSLLYWTITTICTSRPPTQNAEFPPNHFFLLSITKNI